MFVNTKRENKRKYFLSSLCLFHVSETDVLSVFGGMVAEGLEARKLECG